MASAGSYINKKRVMAEAGNLKVNQIGNVATNFRNLQAVLPSRASPLDVVGCSPDFTQLTYSAGCRVIDNIAIKKCT